MKTQYTKLKDFMNNCKIKTKMTYVYLFCVLVPVLATNTVVIGSMLEVSKREHMRNINNIAGGVANNIESAFESAVYITVDLYTSKSINHFLDKNYEEPGKFMDAYQSLFDNYVFYASSKHLVENITFYSDNPTMQNGGKYYSIHSIKTEEWYQKFRKRNADLFVYTYFNNTFYDMQRKRMISVIRKLNYCGKEDVEKMVKLDLNYEQILKKVNNSAFGAVVYVCTGDNIVFSNLENGSDVHNKFLKTSQINKQEMQAHKKIAVYGTDWDIYVTGFKSSDMSGFKDKIWLIVLLFVTDALIPAFALSLFSESITRRILTLGRYLNKVKEESFELIPIHHSNDEIGELLDNYNRMALRMKELIWYEFKSKLEQRELHLARQQAELHALYSQINPHFMFNVLESIRMHSVIRKEEETSAMIESLAKLMRKCAEWGSDYITLREEIQFTKDYLKLQKYRFGDGFIYRFHIAQECKDYKIPSLVLVTFVENACVHGLNRAGHRGAIFISAYEKNNSFYLEIEDTGVGMSGEQVKILESKLNEAGIDDLMSSNSLGMLNASIRLKKYCGEHTKIRIESELKSGTCIIIRIPKE